MFLLHLKQHSYFWFWEFVWENVTKFLTGKFFSHWGGLNSNELQLFFQRLFFNSFNSALISYSLSSKLIPYQLQGEYTNLCISNVYCLSVFYNFSNAAKHLLLLFFSFCIYCTCVCMLVLSLLSPKNTERTILKTWIRLNTSLLLPCSYHSRWPLPPFKNDGTNGYALGINVAFLYTTHFSFDVPTSSVVMCYCPDSTAGTLQPWGVDIYCTIFKTFSLPKALL